MIPESLRNLYDPEAGYFEPRVGDSRMFGGSTADSVYREISQGAASDFWRRKYDAEVATAKEEIARAKREAYSLGYRGTDSDAQTCSDSDALWKWKFYRTAFIDYGKTDDFDTMLKFVREGENGYDDIALADWESEPRHLTERGLAARWHRGYSRTRKLWQDHFGSARR